MFLRNIYNEDDLKNSDAIKDIETYYNNLKRFIECSLLLDKYYNRDSEVDNVDHDSIETFIENNLNNEYENLGELYDAINELQIKNSGFLKKRSQQLWTKKIISFVYLKITNFPKNKFVVDSIFLSKFLESVSNLMYDKQIIRRLDITGEIIGYAHGFCNCRVRENKSNVSVITYDWV